MRPLSDIEACFQGVIPSYLATCSSEGEHKSDNGSISTATVPSENACFRAIRTRLLDFPL